MGFVFMDETEMENIWDMFTMDLEITKVISDSLVRLIPYTNGEPYVDTEGTVHSLEDIINVLSYLAAVNITTKYNLKIKE